MENHEMAAYEILLQSVLKKRDSERLRKILTDFILELKIPSRINILAFLALKTIREGSVKDDQDLERLKIVIIEGVD